MTSEVDSPSILGRSLGVLLENPVPFLLLSFLIQGPQLILAGLRDAGLMEMAGREASPLAILGLLLPILFLTQLQTGFLRSGVRAHLDGRKPTTTGCLRAGLGPNFGPTVGASLLVAVAATMGFGLIIPGWVVLTCFFVAIPALQEEDLNPIAALSRSWQLTTASFFPIFALVLVFTIAERLLNFACLWLEAPHLLAAVLAVPISAVQAIAATVAYDDLVQGPSSSPRDTNPGDTNPGDTNSKDTAP